MPGQAFNMGGTRPTDGGAIDDLTADKAAGAMWEVWRTSDIAPEWYRDLPWDELTRLASLDRTPNAARRFRELGLAEARAALQAGAAAFVDEIARLEKLVYVPGLWRCAKCRFTLLQSNLNAADGSVTARDEPGDKCPNCNSPLWRVTERDAGNEMVDRCEQEMGKVAAATAMLERIAGGDGLYPDLARTALARHGLSLWHLMDTLPDDDEQLVVILTFPDVGGHPQVFLMKRGTLRDSPLAHLASHWMPFMEPAT